MTRPSRKNEGSNGISNCSRSRQATLYTESSDSSVASAAASIATGWTNQFSGGSCTRWSPAPFPPHCYDSNHLDTV